MANDKDKTTVKPTLDGRKLDYAVLHYPIFIPEVGNFPATLAGRKVENIQGKIHDMTVHGDYVLLKEVNYKTKKPVEIWIPLISFTHLVPAP